MTCGANKSLNFVEVILMCCKFLNHIFLIFRIFSESY